MLNGINSSAAHASGGAAFSAALRLHVTGHLGNIPDLFTYFDQYRHREPNRLNVLICDETHRLRRTSNHRFDKPEQRSYIPQIPNVWPECRASRSKPLRGRQASLDSHPSGPGFGSDEEDETSGQGAEYVRNDQLKRCGGPGPRRRSTA
ncbi:hypothetical protein GCM10009555_091800 [Acrocarpospora macrocephala]|uniref:Schlafen group 3-like DNA/RNA helicase domain-containing protein n=1 Tax=Acrocarpospora macrocephala TaxID=150177 RepID=A0A5M3XBF1_9ACTN|nr:hypothetical protein [Acrocarpospora macrocephala]GES16821.1 hypothetical protein Amac_104190 [Acrocarpospora macrocephala]